MSTVPERDTPAAGVVVPDTWFGPSAVLTPANAVTIARLLVSPILLVMIVRDGASWPAMALWMALAVTDGVDGYLARRQGTTRSGAFLDPLADKVLVLGAMWTLVGVGRWWWLPVVLISVRELGIQAFRSYWLRRGLAVPATGAAKAKVVVQGLAVTLALTPSLESSPGVADALLWASVGITLVTGLQYLQAGGRATRLSGSR